MVAKNLNGGDEGLWAACSPFAAILALHPTPRWARIAAPWRGTPTLSAASQRDGNRQPLLILEFHFALLTSNMILTLETRGTPLNDLTTHTITI